MPEPMELAPLKARERALLYLDRRNQPLHLACLALLAPPQDAAANFVDVLEQRLRTATQAAPPFNRRLEQRHGGDWWARETQIDLDQHLVHLSLPAPGQLNDLLAMVARLHALHLDRSCPLWRMYLIEGLSDGRIAVYFKAHAALGADIGCVRRMLHSMSADDRECLPPVWALSAPTGARALSPPPQRRRGPLATRLLSAAAALSCVLADARQTAYDLRQGFTEVVGGRQAPACILNRRISASRGFAARSYPLQRVEALCRSFSCSTRELVLGLCSSALCSLLIELDALPSEPLIALVPTRMRGDDGVRTLPLLVNLGTDLDDPLERLRLVRRSVEHAESRYRALSPVEAWGYTLATSGPGLCALLLRPTAGRLPFNLAISEVAGSDRERYWQGCRLNSLYPLPALIDGMALGIAFTSRGESLDFGLLACARTLPRVQRFAAYLDEALVELEARAPQSLSTPELPFGAVPDYSLGERRVVSRKARQRSFAVEAASPASREQAVETA